MAGNPGAKASKDRFPRVMAGLVPAIHVLASIQKDVDARVKPGHDGDPSAAAQLGETLEVAPFRHLGRPGREVIALDRGGEFGRGTEEPARFAGGKSGEPR